MFKQIQPPINAVEASSFLSMTLYSSRFIEDLESVFEPICKMTRANQPSEWNAEQQHAFSFSDEGQAVRNIVNHNFDPTCHSIFVCDGSSVGVAAALYQSDDNGGMRLMFR